ncbi:uncharacterized protein PV07_04476 [Cladophialophora immunda]|uniref:Uncharacterized protein n=1 Tax=Cladophialophora immunda TaxID=569365 RepID=A0A0D2DBB4_9EURO|nr:uncharacterized protein PV07_04476 [Cladophialophora immunda]KIW32969.1 hypothetical protein PV07_04476 [Cladophialophora immunda]
MRRRMVWVLSIWKAKITRYISPSVPVFGFWGAIFSFFSHAFRLWEKLWVLALFFSDAPRNVSLFYYIFFSRRHAFFWGFLFQGPFSWDWEGGGLGKEGCFRVNGWKYWGLRFDLDLDLDEDLNPGCGISTRPKKPSHQGQGKQIRKGGEGYNFKREDQGGQGGQQKSTQNTRYTRATSGRLTGEHGNEGYGFFFYVYTHMTALCWVLGCGWWKDMVDGWILQPVLIMGVTESLSEQASK